MYSQTKMDIRIEQKKVLLAWHVTQKMVFLFEQERKRTPGLSLSLSLSPSLSCAFKGFGLLLQGVSHEKKRKRTTKEDMVVSLGSCSILVSRPFLHWKFEK